MISATDHEIIQLTFRQVCNQAMLPSGLHGVELHEDVEHYVGHMVLSLTAYVLEDQGGEPVSHTVATARKRRPSWFPQWLWRRLPDEVRTDTLTVHPKWTYPNATIRVPELGKPVQFIVSGLERTEWES